MLEITTESLDAYSLCRPVGELDAYTVNEFREALGGLASASRILIDLSEVPFMDSAGLGALIAVPPSPACSTPPVSIASSPSPKRSTPPSRPSARALSSSSAGEEVAGDLVEALHVVHVGAQERHAHHRGGGHLLGQSLEVLLFA